MTSPKVKDSVLGIWVLYDTLLMALILCLILKMFLVKQSFSRHFINFLLTAPSSAMTKGYTDMLLTFRNLASYT